MNKFKGTVEGGVGNFSYWIEKLKPYYFQKTGMHLFPGTLNVRLTHVYDHPTTELRLDMEEYGGEVSVNIIPCTVFDRKAFILRPEPRAGVELYDKRIIEIACDIKLREEFKLKDGDIIDVII